MAPFPPRFLGKRQDEGHARTLWPAAGSDPEPPVVRLHDRAGDSQPIPSPPALVVKNGSNMLAATSAGMPGPLSSRWTFASPETCSRPCTRMACTRTLRSLAGTVCTASRHLHQVQDHLLDLDAVGWIDRDPSADGLGTRPCTGDISGATRLAVSRMMSHRSIRSIRGGVAAEHLPEVAHDRRGTYRLMLMW
jgi:hypothetical protein